MDACQLHKKKVNTALSWLSLSKLGFRQTPVFTRPRTYNCSIVNKPFIGFNRGQNRKSGEHVGKVLWGGSRSCPLETKRRSSHRLRSTGVLLPGWRHPQSGGLDPSGDPSESHDLRCFKPPNYCTISSCWLRFISGPLMNPRSSLENTKRHLCNFINWFIYYYRWTLIRRVKGWVNSVKRWKYRIIF